MSLSCATADPDDADEDEEIAARGAALDRGGAVGRQQERVEAASCTAGLLVRRVADRGRRRNE